MLAERLQWLSRIDGAIVCCSDVRTLSLVRILATASIFSHCKVEFQFWNAENFLRKVFSALRQGIVTEKRTSLWQQARVTKTKIAHNFFVSFCLWIVFRAFRSFKPNVQFSSIQFSSVVCYKLKKKTYIERLITFNTEV